MFGRAVHAEVHNARKCVGEDLWLASIMDGRSVLQPMWPNVSEEFSSKEEAVAWARNRLEVVGHSGARFVSVCQTTVLWWR